MMTRSQQLVLIDDAVALDLPEDLSRGDWEHLIQELKAEGEQLARRTLRWQFRIADAVLFGAERFGEAAGQFIDKLGLSYWTIAKWASVARNVPADVRRDTLSMEHHRVVRNLPRSDQEQWLRRAESELLSARSLAKQIKSESGYLAHRHYGPPLNFRGLQYEPINENKA
jgi:hypothetical protein